MLDWRVPGYGMLRELRRGTVLARHEASGHPVLLRYHTPEPEAALTARRAEACTLAGLTSPHIVHLYEHIEIALPPDVEAAVGAVTVREYVAGASVRSLLAGSPLPPESALRLLGAGLLGLQCAHEHGVTHRGYKPENLLVDPQGTARLADFAITPDADRSDSRENSESSPRSWILEDVRAAFGVFVASVGGRADTLPRRLRGLTAPGEAGDGATLLDAVERAGRAGWGADWQSRGARELVRRVSRVRGRREASL